MFWGDSLLRATFIANRSPSSMLGWKTPFELLYNRKPDYTCLKFFGCLYYTTHTQPHKDKFATYAYKYVSIGYNPGPTAYKVYDIDICRVLVSRDVVFNETSFRIKII